MNIVDEAMRRINLEHPHPEITIREAIEFAVRRCAEVANGHKCGPRPQDPCGPVISGEIINAAGLSEEGKA